MEIILKVFSFFPRRVKAIQHTTNIYLLVFSLSMCSHSADEGFDGTYHTNIVVKSNGSCLYIPPGKRIICYTFCSTTTTTTSIEFYSVRKSQSMSLYLSIFNQTVNCILFHPQPVSVYLFIFLFLSCHTFISHHI